MAFHDTYYTFREIKILLLSKYTTKERHEQMKTLATALFIARKSIHKGSRATLLILVSILSLSFLNLMFISGILGGVGDATERMVIDTNTGHVTISPQEEPTPKSYITDQAALRSQVEAIPGVVKTAREYSIAGSVAYDKNHNGTLKRASAFITGIDAQAEKDVLMLDDNMVAGRFLDGDETDQIVLGADVAGGFREATGEDLGGVKVGEEVNVTYPNGVIRTYKVKGIYKVGFFSGLGLISAKEAESILGIHDSASQIRVRVDLNQHPIDYYAAQTKAVAPDLVVKKYTDLLGGTAGVIIALKAIALVVSVICVIVAAITIFALIYINAISKRRQIGTLKAVGIKSSIIVWSYVFQALFYTLCGVIIGSVLVFLGLGPLLQAHPLKLPMGDVSLSLTQSQIVFSIVSLFIAALLAGSLPAWRVAKQNILKAIWGA